MNSFFYLINNLIFFILIAISRVEQSQLNLILFKTKHKLLSVFHIIILILLNIGLTQFTNDLKHFVFLNVLFIGFILIEHKFLFNKDKLIKENKYDTKIPVDNYLLVPLIVILIGVLLFGLYKVVLPDKI